MLLLLDGRGIGAVDFHAGDIHHQILALRKKFVKRRIEQTDGHRESFHRSIEADEIAFLQREQAGEFLLSILPRPRQNHALHDRDPVFGKEHVLRPA